MLLLIFQLPSLLCFAVSNVSNGRCISFTIDYVSNNVKFASFEIKFCFCNRASFGFSASKASYQLPKLLWFNFFWYQHLHKSWLCQQHCFFSCSSAISLVFLPRKSFANGNPNHWCHFGVHSLHLHRRMLISDIIISPQFHGKKYASTKHRIVSLCVDRIWICILLTSSFILLDGCLLKLISNQASLPKINYNWSLKQKYLRSCMQRWASARVR